MFPAYTCTHLLNSFLVIISITPLHRYHSSTFFLLLSELSHFYFPSLQGITYKPEASEVMDRPIPIYT